MMSRLREGINMADDTKHWLRSHRAAAGFTNQAGFALALNSHLKSSITEREVGGWERCEKKYRDNVPYQAIATVLNENLPEGKQVTVEQLRRDHKRDIRHCEFNEQRAAAHIDKSLLHEAIERCAPELQTLLLKTWSADGDIGLAACNIAERIRAGKSKEVLLPFSRIFEEVLQGRSTSSVLREQVWRVVDAVARACVIPGTEYKAGQRQEVGTDQAWLIRIRLLIAENLAINGLSANQSSELEDDRTHALITLGVSSAADPQQRVWELVCRLVERYDPNRNTPPNPKVDHAAFKRYCDRLNASLILDSVTKALFFHLMKKPESDEVTDLLYQYLPGLMSFISHKVEGPSEGLLIDSEDLLGSWVARWFYRTERVFTDDTPVQGTSQSTSPQEKNDMETRASNYQSINVNAGDGSTVTLVTGQDKSSPTIQSEWYRPGPNASSVGTVTQSNRAGGLAPN